MLGARWGGVFRVVDKWQKLTPRETAGRSIAGMRTCAASRITVDGIGVGSGPADRLVEMIGSENVVTLKVSRRAHDEETYANRRAEIFWNLRRAFQDGEIDIDPRDDRLYAELASLTYKSDGSGRIQITAKAETRKLRPGMGSPDEADTCAMTYADEVDDEISIAF